MDLSVVIEDLQRALVELRAAFDVVAQAQPAALAAEEGVRLRKALGLMLSAAQEASAALELVRTMERR